MHADQILPIMLASVPTVITVLVGILINNTRLSDLKMDMNSRFNDVNSRFDDVNRRFDDVNHRFDDMKDMWRAELHRVEEVLDARLRHLEER